MVSKNKSPRPFISQGSDIFFYYLAQPIIDAGFKALDIVADITDNLEDRIFSRPDNQLLNKLFNLKRELIEIRKALAPMREVEMVITARNTCPIPAKSCSWQAPFSAATALKLPGGTES